MSNRGLLILLALTILVAIAAALGLREQAPEVAGGQGERLFPELAAQLDGVREVSLEAAEGGTTLRLDGDTWRVAERDGYPADAGKIRQLLLELTVVSAADAKTRDPAKYHYLGVQAPTEPGSVGVLLSVRGEQGPLAELILGKDAGSQTGLFVRRPGDEQAWLARGLTQPQPAPQDWLDRRLLSVPAEAVQRIDLELASGDAYSLVRDSAQAPLELAVPAGRTVGDRARVDSLAGSLGELRFLDVRPSEQPLESPSRLRVSGFDGREIAIEFADAGNGRFLARVQASLNEAAAEQALGEDEARLAALRQEMQALSERVSGRVFELSAFVVRPWQHTLEQISPP